MPSLSSSGEEDSTSAPPSKKVKRPPSSLVSAQPSVAVKENSQGPKSSIDLFDGQDSVEEVTFRNELHAIVDDKNRGTLLTVYCWDRALWVFLDSSRYSEFDKRRKKIKLFPNLDLEKDFNNKITKRQNDISKKYITGGTAWIFLKVNDFETAFSNQGEMVKKFKIMTSIERMKAFKNYKKRLSQGVDNAAKLKKTAASSLVSAQPSVAVKENSQGPKSSIDLFDGQDSVEEVTFRNELHTIADDKDRGTLLTVYCWDRALWALLDSSRYSEFDKHPKKIKLSPNPDLEKDLNNKITKRQIDISREYITGGTAFRFLQANDFETAFTNQGEMVKKFKIMTSIKRVKTFKLYKAHFSLTFNNAENLKKTAASALVDLSSPPLSLLDPHAAPPAPWANIPGGSSNLSLSSGFPFVKQGLKRKK